MIRDDEILMAFAPSDATRELGGSFAPAFLAEEGELHYARRRIMLLTAFHTWK